MTAKRPWKITHTQWQQNSIVDDDDNLVCECCTGHEPSREFADECAADIVRAVNRDHLFDEAIECLRDVAKLGDLAGWSDIEPIKRDARALLDRIPKGGE